MTSTINVQISGSNPVLDSASNLASTLGTLIAGEDIPNNRLLAEQRYIPFFLSTSGTTTIQTGPGELHVLNVTGGQAGSITIYDSVTGSGTLIASFDCVNKITPRICNWTFSTGLTITTSANTLISGSTRSSARVNPMGIAPHLEGLSTTDADTQLNLMQAAGIHWVRQEFTWSALQPTSTTWNFATYDYIVAGIQSRGMQMIGMFSQYTVPDWYRGTNPANQPATPAAFANYIQTVVTHFNGKIPLYEVGNEPNGNGFWYPAADATAYAAMLKAAYPAIKSADSAAKVISGGLAASSGSSSSETFLSTMYSSGVRGYMDYVGYHPYCWPASPDFTNSVPVFGELANIRGVMADNGDQNKQIIVTELGWPTYSSGVTEAQQASYIQRTYQKILYENFQYVAIACIYDLVDDGTSTTDPEQNFGLLHTDKSVKAAYGIMLSTSIDYANHFTAIQP